MKLGLSSLLVAATVALTPLAGQAQDYPAPGSTLKLIVNNNVGGGTDISARLLATGLEKQLGVTVVVENFGGAGGLAGVNRLLESAPDGYSVGFVPLPQAAMYYLDPERGGTFTRADVVPIAIHDSGPTALAVAVDAPWQTLAEFVEDAKANPGAYTSASSSVLATGHLSLLRLGEVAGIDLNWTPMEQQGTAASSLLGGHINLITDTLVELTPLAENGDLRILAVFSDERMPNQPDLPTAKEQGYDVVVTSTRVLIAPKGTPPEIVARIQDAVKAATDDAAYQADAAQRRISLMYGSSEDAAALWERIDTQFAPIVAAFRATAQ